MPLIFPSIKPNYVKTFGLPQYNTVIQDFPDGGETRFQLSEIGAGTTLNLTYDKINEFNISEIMQFYAQCTGGWLAFNLPSIIINHPTLVQLAIQQLKATSFWMFDRQPSVKPDFATPIRGLYSVDIKLKSVVS